MEDRQFGAQHFFIPSCALDGQLVICDDKRTALGRRKMAEHDDRHFFHPESLGRQQTRMARDGVVVRSHEDRVGKSKFADRCRDSSNLLPAVRSRVVRPRNQALDRPELDLDIDVRCSDF